MKMFQTNRPYGAVTCFLSPPILSAKFLYLRLCFLIHSPRCLSQKQKQNEESVLTTLISQSCLLFHQNTSPVHPLLSISASTPSMATMVSSSLLMLPSTIYFFIWLPEYFSSLTLVHAVPLFYRLPILSTYSQNSLGIT